MPKAKIDKALQKVKTDTPKASSQSISNKTDTGAQTLGKPDCPHCSGVGFLRADVPLGHEQFGRLEACVCRSGDLAASARQRLFAMSNLDRLSHLNFNNFSPAGNKAAKFVTPLETQSLQAALEACQDFSKKQQGWILLEGGYGCGKTHLAAAIANDSVNRGIPTLFITVPDLLDSLRFSYQNPETTFETRFEDIRNAALLILDDFGTQNATSWAQEKLFQILNFRYINKLPTVITTNLILDEIESRIRSRLQDDQFVHYIKISAPDYRRPKETSNPGLSMLSVAVVKRMTFKAFETREDEIGKEIPTVTITETRDKFGNPVKSKEIVKERVTQYHIEMLRKAVAAASLFAEDPKGWLVILGRSFSGKTHLAAAVGNYRIALGGQAIMVEVADLLDYLRETFRPNSDVTFDRRFHEITTTPLLILDDLKESGAHSLWAESKLHQIFSQRYYAELPTVITSILDPDSLAMNYPSLWNRFLDTTKCQVHVIDMPPYRQMKRVPGPEKRSRKK